MWEITKCFRFESAHTLHRMIEAEGSRRLHGHSYRAEITLRGSPDPDSGMLVDLGAMKQALDNVRAALDHHFLDEIADLGPATMENLSRWVWDRIKPRFPELQRVTIHRDSLDESASYFGAENRAL